MEDGNAAAESRHAHDEARGEELREMYAEKALEDLVWRMMDLQEYPKGAHGQRGRQVNLTDILIEADASELADIIVGEISFSRGLNDSIESLVKDYLRDSKWHDMRIAEMIEEAKDEQE